MPSLGPNFSSHTLLVHKPFDLLEPAAQVLHHRNGLIEARHRRRLRVDHLRTAAGVLVLPLLLQDLLALFVQKGAERHQGLARGRLRCGPYRLSARFVGLAAPEGFQLALVLFFGLARLEIWPLFCDFQDCQILYNLKRRPCCLLSIKNEIFITITLSVRFQYQTTYDVLPAYHQHN